MQSISSYINPNTRALTSNYKNTVIKDKEAYNGAMLQHLLNPVEDLAQALKTPIKLAKGASLSRQIILLILQKDKVFVLMEVMCLRLRRIAKMAGVEENDIDRLLANPPEKIEIEVKYKIAVTVMELRFWLKDCESPI